MAHDAHTVRPVVAVYEPAAHVVSTPLGHLLPAGQMVHPVEPASAYWPTGHDAHEAALPLAEYVPAAHGVDTPPTHLLPATHAEHAVPSAVANEPDAHCAHDAALASDVDPVAHDTLCAPEQ